MSRRTVFNLATFDFVKHYVGIYNKVNRFLKDFDVENYINFKHVTKLNNCPECHIQISEPTEHEQAKRKLFKLFVNEPSYLVESEFKSNKDLFVPGKGIRNYQFDIFVIHVPNFINFRSIMKNHIENGTELNLGELKEIEQNLYFAVEADGGGHSEAKDAVRDRFFFSNYNIITVRYKVYELVRMQETKKMRKTRMKYAIFQQYSDQPLFHNITCEQIVSEAKNIYRSKYNHIK